MSADQTTRPLPAWVVHPVTPLQRYLAACHRFYVACRDGAPAAVRQQALDEATALEALTHG